MRKKLNDCLQKSNKLVYFTAVNNDAIQGRWNNVETAPHHAWKKLSALLMTLALMMTLLPAALAVDLNVDAGFYFKQSRGGTCTLASAAMMLRRRAYFDGLDGWVDVTENSIKSTAWAGGLSHSFTYNAMHVGYATLPSGKAAKTEALIRILQEHPEGIVLYDRSQPHAVLLTDYTNGVFYCSDPANGVSAGRVPLSSASTAFWMMSNVTGSESGSWVSTFCSCTVPLWKPTFLPAKSAREVYSSTLSAGTSRP